MTSSFTEMRKRIQGAVRTNKGQWEAAKDKVNQFGDLPLPDGQYIARIVGGDVLQMSGKSGAYTRFQFQAQFLTTIDFLPTCIKQGTEDVEFKISNVKTSINNDLVATKNEGVDAKWARLKFNIEIFVEPSVIAESDEVFDPNAGHILTLDQAFIYILLLQPFFTLGIARSGTARYLNMGNEIPEEDIGKIEEALGVSFNLPSREEREALALEGAGVGGAPLQDEQSGTESNSASTNGTDTENPPFTVEGSEEEEDDEEDDENEDIETTSVVLLDGKARAELKQILATCPNVDLAGSHNVTKGKSDLDIAEWIASLDEGYKISDPSTIDNVAPKFKK